MNNPIINKKVSLIPSNQLSGPISFGWSLSPFGQCCIFLQTDTVVGIAFKNEQKKNEIENTIKARWPKKTTRFKPINADKKAESIFFKNNPIKISLFGTEFQATVWKTLLDIPSGKTASYSYIAKKIDNSKAVRAVATAIGQNPIAWLIPCHRIVRKSGALGGYRWGLEIKKMMLSCEIKI